MAQIPDFTDTGLRLVRTRFFHTPAEQPSTDRRECDETGEHVAAVLQAQTDDERVGAGIAPVRGA